MPNSHHHQALLRRWLSLTAILLTLAVALVPPVRSASPSIDGLARIVKDINPTTLSAGITTLTEVGKSIYFIADSTLWRSD